MNYWFIADEHFAHKKIIEYCNRPFKNVEEMDETIINNFNSVVGENDLTIHAGDFCLIKDKKIVYEKYINRLNGKHLNIKGSHDYWLPWKKSQQIWEKNFKTCHIVVCHYAMRTWPRSHYNSFQLYAHSHGRLPTVGKQYDIGVDPNNYYPVSLEQILVIMEGKEDNPNLVKKKRR